MNIQDILNFFKEFNLQTLIGMAILLWIFYSRIDRKLDANIVRLDKQIAIQAARSDKLYEMFVNVGKEAEQSRKESDKQWMELRKEAELARKESDRQWKELREQYEQARKESDRQWKELREQYEQARKESNRQWMELKKESDQRFYDLLKQGI